MSATRDPDRLLRAWLDLMPNEAPDRTIAAVLQATAAAPQVRALPRLVQGRIPVNRISMLATAAALIVAVAGAVLIFRPASIVGPSAPPASAQPSPTINVGSPVDQGLQASWLGGTRSLAGLEAGAGTTLKLQPTTLAVTQANQQNDSLLDATVSILDGRLRVQAAGSRALCAGTEVGTYAYQLSSTGETLTISDAQDPCAARSAVLVGSWWLSDCNLGQTTCLGDMDAGTYGSQYLRPLLTGPWRPKFSGLTFTVPDGWANDSDWPSSFGLGRSVDYGANQETSPRMLVLTQVEVMDAPPAGCAETPATGVSRTPDSVIAHLRGFAGLRVGASQPLSVDGHAGLYVDLSVDLAQMVDCGAEPVVGLLLYGGEPYGIASGSVVRVVFLALDSDTLLAIAIEAPDQATLDSFYADARPIIESFQFE